MLHAVFNRMKCEAEQRAEERELREAVANARHLDEEFNTGKIGVASKLRKRSRAGYLKLAMGNLKR
jgi:hypothetical protein